MELNQQNKPKKKRTVNKAEWTKEKRKRLRIAGQEYVNSKGEKVARKEPGPDCRCRRRCYDKVSKATRMKLFQGYYALKSHDEQNAYLFGLIRKVPIARKRAEGSTRRTCTFNYYIRVGGQETQVCVKALANIHGVGKSKIHILCEKLGQNVLFPRDERGRHSKMPKKVTDDTVHLARSHIYSILHSDRVREFLKDEKANNGPDVNITQMHKDFLDTFDPTYVQDLVKHEKLATGERDDNSFVSFLPNHSFTYRDSQNEYGGNEMKSQPAIDVIIDNDGNTHEVVSADLNSLGIVHKKKRKITKDGRPEPIIRQWYYSKIFHELFTNKESIALKKKIMNWKSNEDFLSVKPIRKQRLPRKVVNQPLVVQPVLLPNVGPSDIQQDGSAQIQFTQRLSKGTNTAPITITTQHMQQGKIINEIPLQTFQTKKKLVQIDDKNITHTGIVLESQTLKQDGVPIELYRGNNNGQLAGHKLVFQTQSQDVYNIYPMILQDITPIDAVSLTHAQPIQQGQIRTLAPTHFQTAMAQPSGSTVAITTGNLQNLQALGVNINITPAGAHYTTTNHGIMGYKIE